MCGIAGILYFDGPSQGLADTIHRMTDTLRHRGPDDEGYMLFNTSTNQHRHAAGEDSVDEYRQSTAHIQNLNREPFNLAFGHRRFAIIDLSAAGHQPYYDPDFQVGGIFNGLVYNYQEVKSELIANGVTFRTNTDTEVLFKAYGFWGEECFKKLNGTWAVAIYDFKRREVLLCRDRLGKKPLYIYNDHHALYFASEMKAILRVVNKPSRVNERAVFDYLMNGCRDLNNSTFYEDIISLPPATLLRVKSKTEAQYSKFWELPSRNAAYQTATPNEVAQELRGLLEDAVKIRLRADLKIGIELSGGLDSSAVAAMAKQSHPSPLTCFTVEFPQEEYNEERYARQVASHLGMDYRVIQSPDRWFWSDAEEFVALHEEPFHSPNLHTQQAVWRLMQDAGIQVILYGAGGDELFAGYRKEYFYPYLRDLLKAGNLGAFTKNFLHFSELSPLEIISKAYSGWRGRSKTNALSARQMLGDKLSDYSSKLPHGGSAEQQLYWNMTELKMPYWLRSNDKNSLAIPVEVRAPLLDYRLVELAFQLPLHFLMRDGWLKWVLRKSVEDVLPASIIWRKRKMGYPFPLQEWLTNSKPIIESLLRESDNPYVDRKRVGENLDSWIVQQPDLVWRILSFELWHRCFVRGQKILGGTVNAALGKMLVSTPSSARVAVPRPAALPQLATEAAVAY